jgi:hypothetical protein
VPGVRDTQCGFKLIHASAVERVVRPLTIDGFAFDVEMLFAARRAGLVVREVGIDWEYQPDSRVGIRMGAAAFLDILRIRWRGAHLRAAGATWLLAVVFAGAVAYDLMQMPVQASDSLGEILDAQASPSVWTSFTGALSTTGYLRPLRIAQIKVLFDLADGHYWPVYRGFHAMLIVACVALFTRALRVRTRTDLAAASFALTVLMGLHTFRGTVQEAFPINHFLEVVVCCLFTLNLTQSAGGARVDALAALTLMVAALTLESGLLVWVVAVSAWMAGLRGISRRGLVAMTTLVAGYMYVRFAYLATGAPTLTERSAGFGLSVLDPPELQRRFGQHPMLFYAYNVVASGLSVLVAEPQSGVFVATRAWLRATMLPRDAIPVATSAVTTIVLGWAALTWRRARALRDDHARLMPVFIAVLGANAALSFAYTKDEIMSVAGVFYALAAYASVRLVLQRASSRRAAALATGCLLFALGSGWAVRSAGVHYGLRSQAFKHRNDWSRLPGEWKREGRWPEDAASQRLIMRLYSEAIDRSAPNPRFEPTWAGRVWAE